MIGDAWGDDIAPERQVELAQRLHTWGEEADHGERKGPFDRTGLSDEERERYTLNGADVFWLAARTLAETDEAQAIAEQMNRLQRAPERDYVLARNDLAVRIGLHPAGLDLAGANLLGAKLAGADLGETNFAGADLREANLSGADLGEAVLSGANLTRARLTRANLGEANLSEASLVGANLSRASLGRADLTRANLFAADLARADLSETDLTGANLGEANLTGADLRETALTGADLHGATLSGADLHAATLARVNLGEADLAGADLREADLSGANLSGTNLSGAALFRASLSNANLGGAKLAGANLGAARLMRATLVRADLARVNLVEANLTGATLGGGTLAGADLSRANLAEADLHGADLAGAALREANLPRANLRKANLTGADLRQAHLSVETVLAQATLSTTTSLVDVVWNNAPLVSIAWDALPVLGDETRARMRRDDEGKKKAAATRRNEYEVAARAYRLLAAALRGQGLIERADRYAYRAQVMQRVAQRRRHHYLRYAGSMLLSLLAGYGYRPLRTLFWYVAVIGGFAAAYFAATHGLLAVGLPPSQIQPLAWYEALVLSVSSFHGRGFFQPVQSLGDPVAILAAAEAVVGLFIEIAFIATFTQRYFGK